MDQVKNLKNVLVGPMMVKECPPTALTKEQYIARAKAGAKTIEEIDRAFAKYCKRVDNLVFIGWVFISIPVVISVLLLIAFYLL